MCWSASSGSSRPSQRLIKSPPGKELFKNARAIIDRVKALPGQLQSWKKSAARAGADIALLLVRIHCKGVDEEKVKNLRVINRKSAKFEDFMEMFIASTTRIANGINLDIFVEAVEPSSSK